MKAGNIIIGILLAAVISLCMGYEQGWAKTKDQIEPARIAVVSVRRILENSRTNAQWETKARAESEKIRTELDKLSKELRAIEADMATRKVPLAHREPWSSGTAWSEGTSTREWS